MTLTGYDTDIDVFLDTSPLDEPTICDFMFSDDSICGALADWSVLVSCCGAVFNFCQEHFDSMLSAINEYAGFWCNACNAIVSPPADIIMDAKKIRG